MPLSNEVQALIHAHIGLVSVCVLIYDHLITFADEATYIWARPKYISSVLFLVNRYLGCFSNTLQMATLFMKLPPDSCMLYLHIRQVLLFTNQAVVCLLLTLRIYALYGCSKRLLVYLAIFIVAGISVSTWSLFGQHAQCVADVTGCQTTYNSQTTIHLAVPYEALFLFDTLIFVLTIHKTYEMGLPISVFALNRSPPLVALLLRDGSIYYALMGIANMSNIISFYVFPALLRGGLSTPSICVSIVMISRLMLNLHRSTDIGIFSSKTSRPWDVPDDDAPVLTTHLEPGHCHLTVLSDRHI